MNEPHKHAALIKAWADGAEIQYEDAGWHDCTDDVIWDLDTEYRIKPEPKYPETRMSGKELWVVYQGDCTETSYESMVNVANAAIRRAIQDGDVILPENKGA